MNEWQYEPAADLELASTVRWRDYRREGGLVSATARACWWSLVKSVLKVIHRLDSQGREFIPSEPSFVLVANHASHLDALVLAATLPPHFREQLFPLAAGDVFFETPARSAFSAGFLNALPVWRKNCGARAIKDLRQRLLDRPSIYILFPEGCRTRDGAMLPFKPGIGMVVAGTSVPVIPCHLSGTFEALPAGAFVPRPRRIRVRIGTPRVFSELPNKRDGWNEIARILDEDIRQLGATATCS
jgi:1-acyl-sn-glycerol-3-phosphate acyltransferase